MVCWWLARWMLSMRSENRLVQSWPGPRSLVLRAASMNHWNWWRKLKCSRSRKQKQRFVLAVEVQSFFKSFLQYFLSYHLTCKICSAPHYVRRPRMHCNISTSTMKDKMSQQFTVSFKWLGVEGLLDDPTPPGWPLWRTTYLCTTSPMRMLSKWPWISRCGDYWQQAELRIDGACRIMMMMME